MSRVHIDHKETHDWIVPRRIMCSFFWIGTLLLFTGIILLVTSRHKYTLMYSSWGYVLLGLGFTLLLVCLILCLHAYCIITVSDDEEPFHKKRVIPSTPIMRQKMANGGLVIGHRKENDKGGNSSHPHSPLLNSQREGQATSLNGRVKITVEDETGVKTKSYYPTGSLTPSPKQTPNNTPRGTPLTAKRVNGSCVNPYMQMKDCQHPIAIKKVLNDPSSYQPGGNQTMIYATPYLVRENKDPKADSGTSSPSVRTKEISKVKLPDGGEVYRIRSLKSDDEIRRHLSLLPHDHDLRRFSNPTVVILDKEDIEASKLSIYDNVRYVLAEK